MGSVLARARPQVIRRWPAWLLVAVLVGLAGGLVTSIVAGGIRTDTAYERFLDQARPSDVGLLNSSDYGFTGSIDLDAVEDLPEVADSVRGAPLFMPSGRADGREIDFRDLLPIASPDGGLGRDIDRQRVIRGRAADPEAADEAVVGFEAVDRLGLDVGSVVELDLLPEEHFGPLIQGFVDGLTSRISGVDERDAYETFLGPDSAPGRDLVTAEVRIVGVVARPGEFPPLSGNDQPYLHLTPAFARDVSAGMTQQEAMFVRLAPGVTTAEFKNSAERAAGGQNVPYIYTRQDQGQAVDRTVHLQAQALWWLAGLVGLSAGLILAQLLLRQARAESLDDPTLRALGFSPGQLVLNHAVRVGAQALLAAAVSLAVAVALSGAWSFGLAEVAEVDPGISVAAGVNAVGVVATAGFLLVVGVTSGWWVSRRRRPRPRMRRARRRLFTGLLPRPLAFGVGTRQALDAGRGDRAVPVRSAIGSVAIGITAFTLAAIFAASLNRLIETPALYGWTWDVQVGTIGAPDLSGPILSGLNARDDVAAVSAGTLTQVQIEGVRVDAFALSTVIGEGAGSRLLEGRRAEAPDEIVLGTNTLRDLEAEVGDQVYVGVAGQANRMTVVGRAVFPGIGDKGQLGTGARLTLGALRRLVQAPARNILLVEFEPDVDADAATIDLARALRPYPMLGPRPPEDLSNLGEADQVPLIAGLAVAGVAVATLTHALLSAARRRRREMGALRAMGFERAQVLATFAGQATTLAVGALLIGLPVGVLAGRWAWSQVADTYGFPAESVTPWPAVIALALAVLLVANLVALGPGWMAARTRPADILRSE